MSETGSISGRIVAIEGSVVDVRIAGRVPRVGEVLEAGDDPPQIIEVASVLGPELVRGLALNSSGTLSTEMSVRSRGVGLEFPVGPDLFGRMLNMFGEPIDGDRPR